MPARIIQIGDTLSHYRILEKLGAGGMGIVYCAYDQRLDRQVAVKCLPVESFTDEDARKRFRREALILSKLNHPNIATIFDFDTEGTLDFIVMEHVQGVTLAQKLARGPLLERDALAVCLQIASGLEEAHRHGIVHCDLKPSNVMVKADGQVKLLDFGLAKLLRISDTATTESMTAVREIGGTLPYMSPEQLRGELADLRSDIYSAGAVLYEMATGHRPFQEKVSTALIAEILENLPVPPAQHNSSLSPRLEDIILKCLEKTREDRYQSAKEFAVDLRRLLAPTSARFETASLAHPSKITSRFGSAAVVAVLVAVLVAIGFMFWHSRSNTREHQVVLIGNIQNRTDEKVFDYTVPELLIIGLEESGYISVFPPSRTSEVLIRMERAPNSSIDEAVGREICQREGLSAFILGSITKLGSRYVLTARAISPGGQRLASTEKVVGNAGELPSSLDRISKFLRNALGEPKRQIEKTSVPLADVTSASLEAIRDFSMGKQKLYAGSIQEAKAYFEQALRIDPSFAMAREYLGIAYLHQGDPARAEEELQKTLPLIDHVTEQEKQKILGDYNLLRRDFDQAIVYYTSLKELRPRDSAPSLNLAQCFVGKLNFGSALVETKAALAEEPSAGPENNLAEIYLLKGDIRAALSTSESILAKDPTNVRGLENRGWAYLLNDDSSKARANFESMLELGDDAESRGRSALADIALSAGQYSEAKRQMEASIDADRRLGNVFAAAKKQIWLATASLKFRGNPNHLGGQELFRIGNDPELLLRAGLFYATAHRRSELLNVYTRLDALTKRERVPTLESFREMLAAKMALPNSPDASVADAKRAVALENSTLALQTLAESYVAAGQAKEAIDAYEKVRNRGAERSQSYDSPAYHELIEVHYRLGVLYDHVAERQAAKSNLEKFLSWWSHPDGSPEIYIDAKRRFRRLISASRTGIPTPAT